MDGVKEILAAASNRTFTLESVIVPDPVMLPGNLSDYSLSKIKDLYAAANQEVLTKYGDEMDVNRFEMLIYFFPTDTNVEPFGMTQGNSVFGLRYKPACVNVGGGNGTSPVAIAHEIGHAFLLYAHAASANPQTGEVLRWAGDPYEMMGYGLNGNLLVPPHLGLIYRYYWGWASDDEITTVTEPGTHQLDLGRALLLPTNKNHLLWLELITQPIWLTSQTDGLLVRIDGANGGVYHATLDMTPATEFQADLHMSPGQSIVFEGRKITFIKSIASQGSPNLSAEIKIEASGPWIVPKIQTSAAQGLAPLTVDLNVFTEGTGHAAQYLWQFSDGSTAEGPAANHTFLQPGQFPVTVTVTDDQGALSLAAVTITVEPSRRLIPFYQQSASSWTGSRSRTTRQTLRTCRIPPVRARRGKRWRGQSLGVWRPDTSLPSSAGKFSDSLPTLRRRGGLSSSRRIRNSAVFSSSAAGRRWTAR